MSKKCKPKGKCKDKETCDFKQELCSELEIEVEAECKDLKITCEPCDDS